MAPRRSDLSFGVIPDTGNTIRAFIFALHIEKRFGAGRLIHLAGLELRIVLVPDPFHSCELCQLYPHKKDEADQYRCYESKPCHADLCIHSLDVGKLISVNTCHVASLDYYIFFYFRS